MKNGKFFMRKDITIVSLLILLSLIAILTFYYTNKSKTPIVEIRVDGEVIFTENLKINKIIDLSPVIIEITDGKVHFKESDCPDQLCVRKGFIHIVGSSAACLPNRIAIKVIEEK